MSLHGPSLHVAAVPVVYVVVGSGPVAFCRWGVAGFLAESVSFVALPGVGERPLKARVQAPVLVQEREPVLVQAQEPVLVQERALKEPVLVQA